MNIITSLFSDPTDDFANKAADHAHAIAKKRGMPDYLIKTAEASAIGAVCAEKESKLFPFS